MEKKQQAFVYDDFGKGLNLYTRDTMIKEKECPAASNIWAVGKNSIAKRPGIKTLLEVSSVNMICGLGSYYSGSTKELLLMAGTKLYKEDSGSATQIGTQTWTEDERVDFCQAGGKVFIQNGTENLREYDGTTTVDTTNGQKGTMSIFYKGSLWVAGDSSYPTRLYRSGSSTKLGDFTYSDPDNLIATSVYIGKDDGQAITGLFKHQDYLYILKENSIWRASQSTDEAATISVELIDPSRGSVQHQTTDSVENDVFFFNDKGAYAFGYEPNITDQIRTNIVSLRVDDDIKAIQKSRLSETCAIYFDNHYYLSYTSGGGTSNDKTLVYDRLRLGWWKFDVGANVFCEFKNTSGESRLYFGSPTDGKVYYYEDTAKSDDSTAISTSWKSPKYSFKDYVQQKFFHHIVLYFANSRCTLTAKVYIDGSLWKTQTINTGSTADSGIDVEMLDVDWLDVSGEASTASSEIYKLSLNKMGKNLQVEITDSENNRKWELNAIEGIFTPINKHYVRT